MKNPPTLIAQTALAASLVTPVLSSTQIVCEGWLLKKRRKKMQGFARRYFVLFQNGLLVYSFEPGQPVRDQVSLYHAAVATVAGRKDIHVDSNNATFHIKCLSAQDFDMWMASFRRFIAGGAEASRKRSASIRVANARQGSIHFNRTGDIVEEIALTIKTLEHAVHELEQSVQAPPNLRDSSFSGRKSDKEKREKFALFKKHSSEISPDPPAHRSTANFKEVHSALDALKAQHAALTKMVQTHPFSEPTSAVPRSLPDTAEEPSESPPFMSGSPRSPFAPFKHPHSKRMSYATSVSDIDHEWFDAEDGPEEYFVEPTDFPPRHNDQQPSVGATIDTSSFFEEQDSSSIDTDLEDDDKEELMSPTLIGQIKRRTHLPVPAPEDEGSLFAILKKNVGRDLATITFPVTFNEPLSMLQRSAEEMEYWELLNQAAISNDPVTRLCYVAAFAVSGYAHTRHRSGRKGFNPMLAETFEDVRMKFIAEKVSHNPVEMAYHAEGKGWELTGMSAGRTKFWGKSLEIIPLGSTKVKIGNDVYVWTKPSSFMRNLMVGTKYIDHCGKMDIENTSTGMRCALDFKQNGYWGPTNIVSGTIHDSNGSTLSKLEGKWDDQMAQQLDDDHLHVLWRCSPFPKNSQEYYGFTAFGVTLNEITDDIAQKLPPTDSRMRKDIRALEEGDLDSAEAEKARIEEMQRERRRNGQDRQPRWFAKVDGEWEYAGGYWEARSRSWKTTEPVLPLW